MSGTPAVEYRRLGNSGLRVSVPILGAMSFGSDKWGPWVINEDKAMPLLKAAWDRGVTTIDTANVYSNGESERIIGKFLKQYNIPRDKVLIFTKCNGLVHPDPGVRTVFQPNLRNERDFVNQSGLSRAAIFNAVDASLSRLRLSYIDLLQIHRFDPETPIAETMKALHDLVESGKVRYIGASSMRAWQFAEMNQVAEQNGWTKFISMQNEYSLLYREEEREMIPYCLKNGIGLIPWGPLAAGSLARPFGTNTVRNDSTKGTVFEAKHSDADKLVIERVEELSKKKGWTMGEVALAWMMDTVSSPIVGVSSPERLEQAIITGKKLTKEEKEYLEEPYAPKKVRGHL
ncbi:Aldo/keto reductase [Schizopora paradoxa]|uniref:Aldo/keto reductase n=1 Tax=Schizopora paradoxa TaxID=27342 RepID=A0A0H2RFS3_9AGAM|nr:Aldo/keto reductase [Schizopora paradoxa]